MKTLHLDKLRLSHVCIALIFCGFVYWIFRSNELKPSEEWQPKASLILNQDVDNPAKHISNRQIPKIIHQTWRNYEVPEMVSPWVKKCHDLHGDWEYWFWTDADIRQLVADLYPQFLALFDSYPASGYRADAFRYFVLFEYGGVYMDLDVECLKPVDPLLEQHTCVLSQEPHEHAHFLSSTGVPMVSNAFMACRREHAFFRHIIEDLKSHYGWFNWNDILRATGPYMLTEEYKYFTRDGLIFASEARTESLYLAEADDFQPTTDPSMRDHMREACIHSQGRSFLSEEYKKRQEELCKNILRNGFREEAPATSYTDHHWTHTWAGLRNDPYNIIGTDRYVDVRTLLSSKDKS